MITVSRFHCNANALWENDFQKGCKVVCDDPQTNVQQVVTIIIINYMMISTRMSFCIFQTANEFFFRLFERYSSSETFVPIEEQPITRNAFVLLFSLHVKIVSEFSSKIKRRQSFASFRIVKPNLQLSTLIYDSI